MTELKPLSTVTFADLAIAIAAKLKAAREGTSRAGWQRLLDLTKSLSGQASHDEVVADRTWRLQEVRAEGYQGIGAEQPLIVELDVTPGITVLHGPNGSGKSSLADAVDTALRGGPRPPGATGTGGNLPLWERQHRGRDADEARVEVTLVDGADRLVLGCRMASSGDISKPSATLTIAGTSRDVTLSEAWFSALAGHQPVFGYANIERRVQVAKDLQIFLEPLLTFGGCFAALSQALDDAAAPAQEAAGRWQRALTAAQLGVRELDQERRQPTAPDLTELAWPGPAEDVEQWLADAGLQDSGPALPEITDDHLATCRNAASAAEQAVQDLTLAEASLHARLAAPLRSLEREAQHRGEDGDVCPVCATEGVDWLSRLTASLADLTDLAELNGRAVASLRVLTSTTVRQLAQLAEVLESVVLPEELTPVVGRLRAAMASYQEAVDEAGHQPTAGVRAAATGLRTALQDKSTASAAGEASRLSEHARQWRLARRAAVESLLTACRDDGEEAAQEPEWKSAAANLRTLQNELRRDRAETLRTTTSAAVEQLLADVGVQVAGLTVSQREAALEIKDEAGKPVSMSMLSAGQRNALLLAPLLALRSGGPFGFLVLDDPVHAFDAVRVDRLAAILGRLARDRRVVVLTHDERLREHLLEQSAAPDLRTVRRDAAGIVHVDVGRPPWRVLIDDAVKALALSEGLGGVGRTDVVRGLCRMAVDDAVRAAVHRHAHSSGLDVRAALASLDDKSTTSARLRHVRSTFAGSAAAVHADSVLVQLQPHLQGWNRSAHGNPVETEADEPEVQAAESACMTLASGP